MYLLNKTIEKEKFSSSVRVRVNDKLCIENIQKHTVMGKLCFERHFSCLDKFQLANVIKKKKK